MCPKPQKERSRGNKKGHVSETLKKNNKNKKMGKWPTVELATQPCVSNRQKENDGKEKVFKNSMV